MNPPRGTRPPTIKDVAAAAGTSHATVSRYLNKRSYVSAASGQAIEAAIREVGYVPNRTARSLVRRQTQAIAFVVREHADLFFADPNLSRMAIGANTTLSAAGYQMFMLIVDTDESGERIVDLILGGFVDGAVLVAMQHDDPVAVALSASATPLVTASRPLGDGRTPSVDTDNVAGSAAITRRLRQTGRERVAEIRGPAAAPVSALRHAGFVQAMGEAYDESLVTTAAEWTLAAGSAAMAELLDRAPDLDGVVAASDLLAAGALPVLRARHRRVPEDVGVVGFDDSPWAIQTQPALSTVRQDATATGVRMAEILLGRLAGEDVAGRHEIIPNQVIWRESA
ncbi:LacI family transcriptional regulator [Georgenia sp. TF02-10]|uniref:LacI family DNA-binding transcriptional regulator n=1 Tax=Georgenia sp. TF02-10 TaxID=2917725 RepID=UPI001FA79DBD|nr:LacI family DNA-binding transcriptional regulator [Georgenia sp. TF02-10]UNX56114.1 LacI family transcriptional regulator [Georgenia sp. TF02-10]